MTTPALSVLEYNLVGYRRTWRGSVFSSFLLPLLTMLGFGVGVGAYVEGGVGGVPYLDWVVPGLLASTALQVAFGDSTWPVLSNFEWMKVYFAQAAAPLRVADILAGHLAFVLFRAVLSTAAFLLVAAAFGALHSAWALVTLPLAALLGLAVAAPVFAYSASISTDSYLALLMRFALVPMSLFSGVFFPVESLPGVLRALAYALPLWHGVDLSRAATLGVAPQWSAAGHLAYLALWAAGGCWLAHARFRRRLVI
ncbi:ABC transporter permease [Spirilliplanes yamanashiensis]|uniref:Transport permease protein n=1 Tax=Spirilliplanes yamanashiensis TaxID=42233 RepID=A0A8J4DMC9_9ACTN|nr:ABC transporter permease [Spirilliplanes yamanashiensis]MDP9816562.1 lipooligosaccharide transport system permease protein [Spirilliplanes yamanashiensis]GIJ06089.1 transport permease protein [Spirilliplanes yamanashiensis]